MKPSSDTGGSLRARPGVGAAVHVAQWGGLPLRRVLVETPCLILVRAGLKRVRCGAQTVTAAPGEFVAVAGGQEIEVTNALPARGPYEADCLAFDPALFEAAEPVPRTRRLAGARALARPPDYLLAAFRRALRACDRECGLPLRLARHHLREVLVALGELGVHFDARHLGTAAAQVRRLLGADPAHGWKAGAVARTLGLSAATLRRRLAREATTFRRLLLQVRMSRALALLQSGDLPVTQIAYAVGYDSLSRFSARFRRHFGQNPARLRAARG